jgi:hypothetical protein
MKTGDGEMTEDRLIAPSACRREARPTGRLPDLRRENRRDSLARAEAVITYLMAHPSSPARERKFSELDSISIIS